MDSRGLLIPVVAWLLASGCASKDPAGKRIPEAELVNLWHRGVRHSLPPVVLYRGSTAAGDFFVVSEAALSGQREQRFWVPAAGQRLERFPLTEDRSRWRKYRPDLGISGGESGVGEGGPFALRPPTNGFLLGPLFTNRVGLIQP